MQFTDLHNLDWENKKNPSLLCFRLQKGYCIPQHLSCNCSGMSVSLEGQYNMQYNRQSKHGHWEKSIKNTLLYQRISYQFTKEIKLNNVWKTFEVKLHP